MRFLGLSNGKLFTTAAVLALLFVVNTSIQAATTLVVTPASINFGLQTIGGKSAPARLAMTNDAIYEVIRHGYGLMPSYAWQLHPEARWSVVYYVRALQRSQSTSVSDLTPTLRAELDKEAP